VSLADDLTVRTEDHLRPSTLQEAAMPVIMTRWEWRTFGPRLKSVEAWLAAQQSAGVQESAEIYFLSEAGPATTLLFSEEKNVPEEGEWSNGTQLFDGSFSRLSDGAHRLESNRTRMPSGRPA
jgi:hypothetical protein